MHILQLIPRVPFPLTTGGAIAMHDVAAGLVQAGHRVTMLAINTPKHHQSATALDHLGPNFRLVTVDIDTDISPLRALKNLLFSRQPYIAERFISPSVGEKLVELLRTEKVDLVQMEGTFVAWYAEYLGRQQSPELTVPPLVLRAHNLEHTIWKMLAGREANPVKRFLLRTMARRLEVFERRHLPQFDAVAAITPDDAQRLRGIGCPEPVEFIPAGVELARFQPDPSVTLKPRTLFMIGSLNWLPNLEGLEWLLREVWPAFHAEMPDVELHIAGSGTPDSLLMPRTDNVVVHGFVKSAPTFMQQYELMVVPLLSGGGMRIKIIEGMTMGKPVLSTRLGAEGIAVRDGHDIVLRDSAEEWLTALRAWACGELPTAQIAAEAARTAADLYDNRRVTQRFFDLYQRLQPAKS
ncbi:glycosyltransferase family 4 protein [Hymenobacter sp. B1770]|uniref:glycosyltransferase family 4 protein n=1 Tax=Hymenobacter sp. B1770 TaxID=1718788 RepID=UPI003CE7C18C